MLIFELLKEELMNLKKNGIGLSFILAGIGIFLNGFRVYLVQEIEEEQVAFVLSHAQLSDNVSENAESILGAIAIFTVPRRDLHKSAGQKTFQQVIANSPIITFISYGGGACGFSAEVAARVFEVAGYKTRFLQIQNQNGLTHHVVIDVEKGDFGPCVVDPIFGHIFIDEHGHGLSAAELERNWSEVQRSLPDGNRLSEYSYEYGVQFTNWSRFGLLEAPIKALLSMFVADLESISLRSWYNGFMRFFPGLSFTLSFALIWLGLKKLTKLFVK